MTPASRWRLPPALPVLLVALALVKGLVWTLSIPSWYGPDERTHFSYVELILIEHRLPRPLDYPELNPTTFPPEVACSMWRAGMRSEGPYYAEPPWGADPHPQCPIPGDQSARTAASDRNSAADYLPFYYGVAALFYAADWYGSVDDRLHAIRFFGVLLGAAATLMTYFAGFWFLRSRTLAGAAAVLFAMQPMASQQFAVVSNDALTFALAAAFFWRFFRALALGLTAGEAAFQGALIGLAYVAKPHGALLLFPFGLLLLIEWWRRRSIATLFRSAAVAAGAALVPVLIGFAVAALGHGVVVPHSPPVATYSHGIRDYLRYNLGNHAQHLYGLWIQTAWGNFAWLAIALPAGVYVAIAIAQLIAAGGLAVGFARRRWPRAFIAAGVAAVAGVALLLLVLDGYYFRRYGYDLLQGRSFFFLLPAGAVLFVAGVAALVPRTVERYIATTVALATIGLNFYCLFVIWQALFL